MVIYKTTNLINGKIYVGQDINNNKKYLGSGKLIKLAIKKYGKTNFKKEIIEECSSINELNKREKHWISKLNSQDSEIGYNISEGGDSNPMLNRMHDEKTKKKMSDNHADFSGENNPMFGKSFKEVWDENGLSDDEVNKKWDKWLENRSKLSTGRNNGMYGVSRFGPNNPFYGKKHSDEVREKLRNKAKKKIVLQYDLEGNFIKEWESTMQVYRELGINCRNCCRGISKTACGFIWKYKENYEN